MLWDTGATHTIINPKIVADLNLVVKKGQGPTLLSMADDHTQKCSGVVENLQILAGQFKERVDMIVADIGSDDIIVGNDILEPACGGHGRGKPGFWQMIKGETIFDIPLIGEGVGGRIEKVSGVKKIRKLLQNHGAHLRVVHVRKTEDFVSSSNSLETELQDKDGETRGESEAARGTEEVPDSARMKAALRQHGRRYAELERRMAEDKAEFDTKSEQVKEQLKREFPDLFTDPQSLPPLRHQNHRIELEEGAMLPKSRGLPRLSHTEMEETRRIIDDFVRKGWIEPSMSPHGAALFFVPKPSGRGLRAVSDYRQINKITKKILPSLPLVENILTQMEGAQFFSGLDLTSFFYQIRVEPEDVPLTAMRTIYGMYQFKVCPMGMTGSVGTAMANMESILSHVISLPGETLPANPRVVPPLPEQPGFTADESWKLLQYHSALGSYCCVFIDDILIHSRTEEEHLRHLRQVCATLVQHKLYLNLEKCEIMKPQITYLGNIIGRYGTMPTKERTQAVRLWPTPMDVSDVRAFLGLCGFVRRWIPDFADLAAPLNLLLKKGEPWRWGEAQELGFEELKIRCATPPVLAIPTRHDKLVVRTDASREAMGIAIYRRDADGYLQPVEYKSKAFVDAQKKLPAHDRECLALLYALKSFRHYLLHREFEVQTDNSALAQVFSSRDLSDLYARWYHKIAEFSGMRIVHRPGRKMWCADALSRRRQAEEDDPTPFEVEPGELAKVELQPGVERVRLCQDSDRKFYMRIVEGASVRKAAVEAVCHSSAVFSTSSAVPEDLQRYSQEWPAFYEKDPEFQEIWRRGGQEDWGFFRLNGLLWKEGPADARLCVPAGADRTKILAQMHDALGHPGKHRTLARVLGSYYWRGAYSDTVRYVRSCHKCQLSKQDRRNREGDARALPVPAEPWEAVHMDWITGLPKAADGSDAVLVFIDALTGMVHFQACQKTDTSKDTAQHFVHNVVRLHGVPRAIHSDRDIRLTAHFWKSLQERLGTELRFTTRHHPQANGKVERANATLTEVLRSMCDWAGRDWRQHLDMAEFVVNGSASSVTGMTPFFSNFAREPRTPANVGHPRLNVPAADEMADAIFAAITHTRDAMQRAKQTYEKQGRRGALEQYQAGDKVLLSTSTLNLRVRGKLTSKFVGPFEVLPPPAHATNPNVVWLKVPRTFRIHMPINVKEIKRYISREADLGGPPEEPPEPIVVDGADHWEVECVLAERTKDRQRFVLVKWLGFDITSATWEPLANIPDQFIQQYRERVHQESQ